MPPTAVAVRFLFWIVLSQAIGVRMRREDAPRFRPPHLHNNVIQLWAERGILAVVAYLMLLGLFLRECVRGWRGQAREFAEAGVAITVGLAYAGLFEFNFGDTEVFLIMLELFALIVDCDARGQRASPTAAAAAADDELCCLHDAAA